MQVLFLVAAGAVVAPFIFGLVSVIVDFLVSISAKNLGIVGKEYLDLIGTRDSILFLLQAYILIEATASGTMIAMIREGKATISIIYIPILLLVAFTVYFLSLMGVQVLLGGIS